MREALDFIWLELTNKCNLQCVHCYAESGPFQRKGALSECDYKNLIDDAYELGCRKIQFIGGEPVLNSDLLPLIEYTSKNGYSYIEVFTNLQQLPKKILDVFRAHRVRVATSLYAETAHIHDQVTKVKGSFNKTILSLRKLLDSGVPVRVGVIEMKLNQDHVIKTVQLLNSMGIYNVGIDRVRPFGRGIDGNGDDNLASLCGNCSNNVLCVGFDGNVSPCIMSKKWLVGSVFTMSLSEIVESNKLSSLRKSIYRATIEPLARKKKNTTNGAFTQSSDCNPQCQPTCSPNCSPTCNPISCNPRECWPAMCIPT